MARADGWRLLQTLGEENHSPEDFEQLLLPPALPAPVGRLSVSTSMLRRSVSNAAAEAGVTPVRECATDDLDNAGQTLRDPFKVSAQALPTDELYATARYGSSMSFVVLHIERLP